MIYVHSILTFYSFSDVFIRNEWKSFLWPPLSTGGKNINNSSYCTFHWNRLVWGFFIVAIIS